MLELCYELNWRRCLLRSIVTQLAVPVPIAKLVIRPDYDQFLALLTAHGA